jgi:hypothetical protein
MSNLNKNVLKQSAGFRLEKAGLYAIKITASCRSDQDLYAATLHG